MTVLKRVLHVDDDSDIREITRISLVQIGGFVLLQCRNAAEAIEKAEAFLPDLLLLDMQLPDAPGVTILKELQKIEVLAKIPALFLTGQCMTEDQAFEPEAQIIGIIQKPFDPITLARELSEAYASYVQA